MLLHSYSLGTIREVGVGGKGGAGDNVQDGASCSSDF